jgi:hypothetical protein
VEPSDHRQVNGRTRVLFPAIALDRRGTVGTTYDAFRSDAPGDGKLLVLLSTPLLRRRRSNTVRWS